MSHASPYARAAAGTALLLTLLVADAAIGQTPRQLRARAGGPLALETDAAILEVLRDGEITKTERLGSGTTGVRRLEIVHEGQLVRAVFRHVDVYEQNLRMRDGTNYAGFYDQFSAECAAYELGRMLGLDMIPPAVLRRVSGDRGSVQLWVEDAMTEGERNDQGLQPPNNGDWRRQQAAMRVFDALIANSDRNTGNSLIDEDWNVWLIDHSRSFQVPRGNMDFSSVTQVPASLWDGLVSLDEDAARNALGSYLDSAQIRALFRRYEALVEHIEGLIVERGVEAVIIPDSNE